MKLIAFLLRSRNKQINPFGDMRGKTISSYKQEAMNRIGKQQFEKLKDLGLSIPVRLA
jgi:hypothetical protein